MFKSSDTSQYVPSKSQAVKPDVVSDVQPQDEVRMLLPSFLGFIDPSQSYLRSIVQLSGGRGACVPDPKAGAHALFRNIVIRDGSNTATLENIEDYNCMVSMTRPFQDQSTVEHKRQLAEGRQAVAVSGTSLYYGAKGDLTGTSSAAPNRNERTFLEPEVYLRPETGLFMQSKSIPIGVMQGLRLQIDMEEQSRALELISTDATETSNTVVQGTQVTLAADMTIGVYTRAAAANQGIEFLLQVNTTATFPSILFAAATSILYVKKADRVSATAYFRASDANDTKTGLFVAPSYSLKDVEFRAMTITPPDSYTESLMRQAASGKGFDLQILSVELHRVNQNNTTGVSQIQIPTMARMAKSIISQPLSISAYRDFTRSSFKGIPDFARDYQWQLGNELVPTRRVPLSRYSQGGQSEPLHLTELQKALINAEKDVRTLHRVEDNFAIARALNRYKQFTDLSDETVSLRVDYDAGASQKIFNNYIYKLVDISVEKGQVIVMS